MMRSKLFSKNLVKAALPLFSLLLLLTLSGCQESFEPTFKGEDIPYHVKQICKEEYGLDVLARMTDTTIWIYIPLQKILHKEYGVTEGKVLDEEMTDKLRNILTTVGRVLLSADKAPEFFALWSSDINIGLDYIIMGNVMDIKKSYGGDMPSTELNKRYVMKFGLNTQAIKDASGSHLKFYNITLPDFLTQQMVQRLTVKLQAEELKNNFKIEKIDGIFNDGAFILEYSAKSLEPAKPFDIMKEFLNIVNYCVKAYDFRDFSRVEINDLLTGDRMILDKATLYSRPLPAY
ncbi:MAG: hypothetical protein PHE18_00570 [Candidatus Omnitrophica bacterium]|nr:hypothetical protein [Candidatus Omnitrophota bacterium]MDD5552356.1 hypothetical protein [Candidatus Omnitrophota bacterium]